MDFKESPSISEANRKAVFPVINWLSKTKFEGYLKLESSYPTEYKIYPYLNSFDDLTNEGSIENRIFVGKSMPQSLDEGKDLRWYDYTQSTPMTLEIIGSVMKNLNGEWELRVPHGSSVKIYKKDFLTLCISDPDSFNWVRSKNGLIPRYALRGANDVNSREYFYIGRTIQDVHVKGQHYSESWSDFNEMTPKLFGKIHVGHKLLYVPHNSLELAFSEYEALCLKPSPAPLKILARLKIRNMLDNSNKNITLINKNHKILPDALLKFLLYPAFLGVGEYLLKGEKITDDKNEILIENNGDLVCKPVFDENDDCNVKRIIWQDVHSVWLHRFQLVFVLSNNRFHVAHSFSSKSPDYKFSIDYSVVPPSFQVKE
jgi:hypothetical protein